MTTLKDRTFHALKWSYLSFFTNLLLQPLFSALLARLLGPKEFGVVAAATVLYSAGYFLADLGVGVALVQKKTLTNENVRAAFTASVVLGLLSTALAWVIAPLAGPYFEDPAVVPVARAYAASYILSTLVIVSTSLLRRALRFKPIMIAEVSSYVLGIGVTSVGMAYLGFGAFSLPIGVAVQYVVQLVVTYAFARHSLRPIFRWSAYRDLFGFGSRATLVTFLEFLSSNIDTLMIGRLYDSATLGLYNRAYNTVCMPLLGLARNFTRVLAPSFGQVQDDQAKLRTGYLTGLQALSLVLFTLAFGVLVCAPEIVHVLLGDKFAAAVPVMQVLALFIPFPVLSNLAAVLAEATARLNVKIAVQTVYLAVLAAAFWGAHRAGLGLAGFALALFVVGVMRDVAYAFVARGIIGGHGGAILRAHLEGLAAGLLTGVALLAAVWPLRSSGVSPFVIIAVELVVGGGAMLLVTLYGPSAELRVLSRKLLRAVTDRLKRTRDAVRS
ncbi:lipopolysaccharide biosynthesis protein [Deinococcus pimensis]|uniref:lipopolysaccharide biosynthesis protein n=1 Tax=Deinococcus pimensis TaxID=309888 RepID=UPI000487D41E|nr:lipopolysaccharide biosynthesis protein [Deinococcus pimensis]